MREDYGELFRGLTSIEPPQRLLSDILLRIKQAQKRAIKIRLVILGVVVLSSAGAAIPAFQYSAREFYQSGFYQYLLLLFSDSGAVLEYWKEFGLSLAESLPVPGAAALLSVLFVLLGAMELILKNFKKFSYRLNLSE